MTQRLRNMTLAATAILAMAAAGTAEAQAPEPERTITVTGVRLNDLRRELEACLARGCPPMEDMAATFRYAEGLFLDGDYRNARRVLRQSIGRNREHAERYPIVVAGLFRANARMAMHEGDGEDVRRSTLNVERSLRAGLPASDPRIIGAQLEIAEMHAALGQNRSDGELFRRAENQFREAARAARAINRSDLAALADLRRAILAYRIGRDDAREQLEAVARLTSPETRVQQLGARIVLATMDRNRGDSTALDRLHAELSAAGLRAPVLLYAPPVRMPNAATTSGVASMNGDSIEMRNMSTNWSSEGFDYWADVGFWITGQGRVEDVEVLRSHGPQHWLQPVLGSIAGRLYAPPASNELSFRVERYRFTSLLERRSDRRTVAHSAQGRIEMLDITNSASADSAPAEAEPPPTSD